MTWTYSRWDGSQAGYDLDADWLLGQMNDDLAYHGDIAAALRRLLQQGFTDRDGRHVQGLQEIMERLRQRRRDMEREGGDLGGVYEEIARELDEIVETERSELSRVEQAAESSGDQRRAEVSREYVAGQRIRLGLLPRDLAGRVRELRDYDFASAAARERFEQLLDRLREELTQSVLDSAAAAATASPEEREHLRAALDALNRMLEQRAAGEPLDPSFEEFMAQFGDLFPGDPATLDELLEQLAARMAAMSSLLASMSPEQRAQLASLMEQMMSDLDLSWQMNRLAGNLRAALPDAGWDRRRSMGGSDPLGLSQAADLFSQLGEMDQLEQMLRGAASPGALAEIDPEQAAQLLGPDAAASLSQLAELTRELERAGLIEQREGRPELTPRGIRRIGAHALSELFGRLARDRLGKHEIHRSGIGSDRALETKPYEYGDPFDLNIERTIRNAIVRRAGEAAGAAGAPELPVRLSPDDFEVERAEDLTRAATVLMIDLSLSMPMRDNFLAAKKVAMALQSLITSQFPRDYLGLVGFSEVAREITARELPEVSWDFVYGTNMQHAFALARKLLARQSGTKQIVMITDGEPTAHVLEDGEVFFHYPPVQATVDATLAEVNRCTREGVRINTFVLDATGQLRRFVETMTRINRGRAFFTTPDALGEYVLVDYIEQRRAVTRRGAAG